MQSSSCCEVLRWRADEVAGLLETSVASVNSALQRARATLAARQVRMDELLSGRRRGGKSAAGSLRRCLPAYDMDALTALLYEDATFSMPPHDLWLQTHRDIKRWCLGPGIACRGSRLVTTLANGSPAFGQYKPAPGGGFEAWSLQVLEMHGGRIAGITFFLDTARWFPLFGLPLRLGQ